MSAHILSRLQGLDPYVPGLSIDEIQQRYGLGQVIKLASNENPLGVSPLAQEAILGNADRAFRYPQGGNPRLTAKLAKLNAVSPEQIVIGNGSDEIIDLLIRILAEPGSDNLVCSLPCFSIYPLQGLISGVEVRRVPLKPDFSFDFAGLLNAVNQDTRMVFLTTPDNPSGYCPPVERVRNFANALQEKAPDCLLVVDEAYMDFAPAGSSLAPHIPPNVAIIRTFSKSYGLAGLRVGYAILPPAIASGFWAARLPFSVNILAEEACLAALEDEAFRNATLKTVREGRAYLSANLSELGCTVWPSAANFLMFKLPPDYSASDFFQYLLKKGVIIRSLKSYNLPDHLRVSIGNKVENEIFIRLLKSWLEEGRP